MIYNTKIVPTMHRDASCVYTVDLPNMMDLLQINSPPGVLLIVSENDNVSLRSWRTCLFEAVVGIRSH